MLNPKAVLISLFAFVAALSSALSAQAGAGDWDARIISTQGAVAVFPSGASGSVPAATGMPLEQGDRVTTGPGSSAEVGFDGLHLVSLNEDTDFTLRSDARSSTELSLASGGLLAKIHHLLSGQALRVETPDAVAAVRGTEFGVGLTAQGTTDVGVFDEGRVAVSGAAGGPAQILTSNQETDVPRGGPPARPHALRHFLRYRARMVRLLRRQRGLRRLWRRMPASRRRLLRREMIRRARARRVRRFPGGRSNRLPIRGQGPLRRRLRRRRMYRKGRPDRWNQGGRR
ncbi:MAG: FecR domain-containing protein [Elusimicrobia bacterium]|nr:FecR domain-containing protein [Elusimicrobiota bacterium]